MGKRRSPARARPTAATILYALAMLSVAAVALALGGDETAPAGWALVAVPAALFTAASLIVRREPRAARAELQR
jgi:hypothetical protein